MEAEAGRPKPLQATAELRKKMNIWSEATPPPKGSAAQPLPPGSVAIGGVAPKKSAANNDFVPKEKTFHCTPYREWLSCISDREWFRS